MFVNLRAGTQKKVEVADLPGARVAGSCELFQEILGTEPESSIEVVCALN